MDKQELINKLKPIIKPYSNNMAALENMNEDTDFIKDLNINSANLVDIVLDIEEQFDVVIENTDMERMLNIRAALDIIETKLAEK
jgi:acyl carrier protein